METLVVVAQQDQFHSRSRGRNHGSFGSYGSYPSRDFREINCRSFQSGSGILPIPLRARSPPVTTKQFSPNSPKTPSSATAKKHFQPDQNPRHAKRITKSSSVPIQIDIKHADYYGVKDKIRGPENDNFFYSELWAGPAYSNSPPPSSLPIPKFSIKPKRTVSLDLPSVTASEIDLLTPLAKSAPPSPTREHHKSSRRDFFNSSSSSDDDEFATKTLRRILNLDLVDE